MIGKHLGPYEILELLGRGGMGEVYRARDNKLERDVAIKILSPAQVGEPEAKARFLREARLASALDHPNICSIYQVDETDDGQLFIVMAFYRGETLTHRMRTRPLPIDEALRIGGQIASGLAKAHSRGIVHRDLKPSNVMLTEDGLVKVLDFGLAKMTGDETITREGSSLGTPGYMSPEQIAAQPMDARSDVWTMSVLMHEMLTGQSPFKRGELASTLNAILHDEPQDLRTLDADIPKDVAALIMQGLSKDPAGRPDSLNELLDALGLPGAGAPSGILSRSIEAEATLDLRTTPHPPRPTRSRRWLPMTLALLILAAGVFGAWQWFTRPEPTLQVLVLPPEITGEGSSSAAEVATINLQSSIVRSLTGFESMVVTPVETVTGTLAELARQFGADEVFRARAVDSGSDWQVQLSRLLPDESILWTAQFRASPRDGLGFASAVAAHCGQAYAGRPAASGRATLEVESDDYERYLAASLSFDVDQSTPNLESVLETLDAIESSSPRFVDAFLLDGQISRYLFATTRDDAYFERGKGRLAAALAIAPNEIRAHAVRFTLDLRAGHLDDAAASIDAIARSNPGSPQIPLLRARLAQKEGDFDAALALMAEAVSRQPTVSNLGDFANLQYSQNLFPEALRTLDQILSLQPSSGFARAKMAEIELLHGSAERAAELYTTIVADGGDATEYSNLGLAQQLIGDFEAAEISNRRAESFAPGNPYILLNLADSIAAQGRRTESQSYYQRVVDYFDASEAELDWADRLVVAQCQAQLGEGTAAVTNTQLALQAGAEEAEAYFMASLVYCLTEARVPALVNAKEALRRGYSPRWFGLPWFDLIRDDGEFAQLTGPTS